MIHFAFLVYRYLFLLCRLETFCWPSQAFVMKPIFIDSFCPRFTLTIENVVVIVWTPNRKELCFKL